jgi:ATP synthase mitochondrial F1 complex assembly factor 1
MSFREGLNDLNELKAVYQEKIQNQRQRATASDSGLNPKASFASDPSHKPPTLASHAIKAPSDPNPSNSPGVKTLSSYIDISKTLQLPPKEIESIWRLRHASDPRSLCAVIPYPTYSRVAETARRHPQFILPLPREGQGAEIHFLQWTFPTRTTTTVLFTHLAEFKLRGEFSQPHTTVTHHLDIAEPRGLVLLQGNVMEGRGVTVDEGKWLLMGLQKFYGGGDHEVRRKLLEQFNQGDGGFKVEELLEEAEKII